MSATLQTKIWMGCGTIRLPWYTWPLAPLVFCASLVVMVPVALLAFLSIPYYFVFPQHRRQLWDYEGTAHQRMLLQKWRAAYAKLSLAQRVARAFNKRRFRKGRR